jgi:hypothetical protein
MPVMDGRKADFVKCCMAYGQREKTRLEQLVSTQTSQVDDLAERLRRQSRDLQTSRRTLEALLVMLAREQQDIEADFDQLTALPHVVAVETDDSAVRVFTDVIHIEHAGRRHKIGMFVLDLDLERGIAVNNVTNTGQKLQWDHPHVQGGKPCLGGLRSGLERLLGECQFAPLVSMLIQFLESYDEETAYSPVTSWAELP